MAFFVTKDDERDQRSNRSRDDIARGEPLYNTSDIQSRDYRSQLQMASPTSEQTHMYQPIEWPISPFRPYVKNEESVKGDYATIKQTLLSINKLWIDPDFPASQKSLNNTRVYGKYDIRWMRPHEISPNPKFIEDGTSRFDIQQGGLGNCWFLAAIASLAMHKPLLNNVVPPEQTFNKNHYCGIFRFRFWRYGVWTEVLVDDRLPTVRGRLVFMHSQSNNEFWSALLEKAYAKLMGSYNALIGGCSAEAMEDLTGGITESYHFAKEKPNTLFEILLESNKRGSLIGCSTEAHETEREFQSRNGIVKGHAYTITDVKRISSNQVTHELLRVRNPWGNKVEWNGPWSDNSREWNSVSEMDREKLGLVKRADGEFWINFSDFMANFTDMEICHLGPDAFVHNGETDKASRWECHTMHGAWKRKVNDGGCLNYPDTFPINPQYRVDIGDVTGGDEGLSDNVVIGITLKNTRRDRKQGDNTLCVGYAIYKVNKDQSEYLKKRLDKRFFSSNHTFATSQTFLVNRVSRRHQLPSGHYVIIPSTFDPGRSAEFLLRIFSQKANLGREHDDTHGIQQFKKVFENPTVGRDPSEKQLWEKFERICNSEGQLDTRSLRTFLNRSFPHPGFTFDGFSEETCRSMVALYDINQNDCIDVREFMDLWKALLLMKNVYKERIQPPHRESNETHKGIFPSYELRSSLEVFGYRISNGVNNALIMRYSNEKGEIRFDEFVRCCCRLKAIFDIYQAQSTDSHGNAVFSVDQFFRSLIYV